MDKRIENKLKTLIDKSGNSDVDLVVNIETKAIAYSILCGLYARGDISESELDKAIEKLDSLIERDKRREKNLLSDDSSHRNKPKRISNRNWI